MKKKFSYIILSVLLVLIAGYGINRYRTHKKLQEKKKEVSTSYSEEKDWKREYNIYGTIE